MTLARTLAHRSESLEDPSTPLNSSTLAGFLDGGLATDAGVTVTPTGSLAMSAVWRAVTVTSGVAASLPLKGYLKREGGSREPAQTRETAILRHPHPEMTDEEFWRLTYTHRYLGGNFYGYKHRNGAGQIEWIEPLAYERMQVGTFRWARGASNPTGKVFAYVDDAGAYHVWTPVDVLHIPGFGYDGVTGASVVRMARHAIALGLAAEKSASKLFGSGTMMAGVLQTEQRLTPEQAKTLKSGWRERMGTGNPGEIAVLDSGAAFKPVTMTYVDAQFLESRQFQIGELERFLGVPPFLMFDTEKSTSWGTGLEQQATGWVKFDLGPSWLTPTERRITKELLAPTNPATYAEYTIDGLLRGDTTARGAFYRIMREVGAYSANDIRAKENEPAIEDGDIYLQPTNLAPLGWTPNQGVST